MIDQGDQAKKVGLLMLASTYPRWREDTLPNFVHDLAKGLVSDYRVYALVPHFYGAKTHEALDDVEVMRFRYAPERKQRIAYCGGMLAALKGNCLNWLILPVFFLAQIFSVLRIIHRESIAVVHCHWMIPQGVSAFFAKIIFRKKIRVVLTVHGGDLYAFDNVLGRVLKKAALWAADEVVVVSNALRIDLQEKFGEKKITVLPMGVDLTRKFTPPETSRRSGLLFVGRLVGKKGVLTLIKAYALAVDQGIKLPLTIVGDGPLRLELESLVETLGLEDKVVLKGAVENSRVIDYYQKAELVVMPSETDATGDAEGLGLVLVEALGCGAKALVSDIEAFKDITAGLSAVTVFRAGDFRHMAGQLLELSLGSDQDGESVSDNRGLLIDKFDWSGVCARYKQIYQATYEIPGVGR